MSEQENLLQSQTCEKENLEAIGMSMDWFGVTSKQYDRLREVVGFDSERSHIFDVWKSEEHFHRFRDKRLMPGVREVGIKGQPQVHTRPEHALCTPGLF